MSPAKTPALTRRLALTLLLAALCLLAATASSSHARTSAPTAHAAKTCSVFSIRGGYVTSLSVRGTSCRTGKRVALAYTKCRQSHGLRGRCHSKVRGFSCKEGKRESIADEFDARVTCRRGSAKVVHTYQQNLD